MTDEPPTAIPEPPGRWVEKEDGWVVFLPEWRPTDSYEITVRGKRYTVFSGPCPMDTITERGSEFVGQVWIVNGTPRTIKSLDSYTKLAPLQKGDPVGVIFEPDEPLEGLGEEIK